MNEQTALDTLYIVNSSNKNVTLEIIIGAPGQTATSLIQLDEEPPIESNFNGSYPETKLDSNKNLNGKTLDISTTITDTSPDTNYTELIIRIRGGVAFKEYHLAKTVTENGTASYACSIKFINASA